LMPLLHRDPDEAVFAAPGRWLRREVLDDPAELDWDLGVMLAASAAEVDERDGVIIVTVGELPDPLPVWLTDQLDALIAARPVIVDLSGLTVVAAAPLVGLAGWVLGASSEPGWCSVVCPRATARALLHRWHITRCIAVFGSVGDALQARRFAHEGYGRGWHPDSPHWHRPNHPPPA